MLQLCFALPEGVPDWIEILPAGEVLRGVDGREFLNPGPDALIAAFNERKNKALPIDINHGSEHRGPALEARAIGWIVEMENRDGSVWARVEWNDEGRDIVANKRFRFLSPAFYVDEENKIVRFSSVGVVNHPNFESLAALNGEVKGMHKDICDALGLSEDASVHDAVRAINASQLPDPKLFVPRADYDLVCNAKKEAEDRLAEIERKAFESKVDAAINDAVKAGKIAPASKDFYRQTCRTEADLEALQCFVSSSPTVVNAEPEAKEVKNVKTAAAGLTEQQKHLAWTLQLDPEEYAKALAERGNKQ